MVCPGLVSSHARNIVVRRWYPLCFEIGQSLLESSLIDIWHATKKKKTGGLTLPLLLPLSRAQSWLFHFSLKRDIFQIFRDFRDFKIQHIPIWDRPTSLSIQFICMYYNSNDRVESLFCRQQGGVQAPRIRSDLKLACLIFTFFFSFFLFAGDIYS